jgi:hypothetical protein
MPYPEGSIGDLPHEKPEMPNAASNAGSLQLCCVLVAYSLRIRT